MTTRNRRRRAVIALFVAPALCGLLVAGLVTTGWVLLGSPTPAGAVWMQVARYGSASDTGAPNQPFFVLLIGTGARSDDPAQSPDDPGLADAIHVLGVNPAMHAATLLDIPRDTEGPDGSKLNSYIVTSAGNGLRAEADAVSAVIGMPLNYVIRVNFPHFIELVDSIGGVDVNSPIPLDDDFSGAHFPAGPLHLDGPSALAYARDRHSFANGDLTRTSNQGVLILAALQQIKKQAPDLGQTVHLVATLGRHVKLDGIGIPELFHMGELALTFDPANIKNVVLPVGEGSGSNLVKSPDAASLLADFADDAVLENH